MGEPSEAQDISTSTDIADVDGGQTTPKNPVQAVVKSNGVENTATNMFTSHTVSVNGSHFRAYCAKAYNMLDVLKYVKEMRDGDGNLASHNIVAYSLSTGDQPRESCQDGGEKDAGGKLLRFLQQHKLSDIVVVVLRWYGGSHIGPSRFEHIITVARAALTNMGELVPGANDIQQNQRDDTPAKDSMGKSRPIDHVILHDSTGNHIEAAKMFKRGDISMKGWAPLIENATEALRIDARVRRSITLITGIRHVTDIMNKTIQLSDIENKVVAFLKTAKQRCPDAKVTIVSILPSDVQHVNTNIMLVNNIYQETAQKYGALFCNSNNAFTQKRGELRHGHPTKTSVALLVWAIKSTQGLHSRTRNDRRPPRLQIQAAPTPESPPSQTVSASARDHTVSASARDHTVSASARDHTHSTTVTPAIEPTTESSQLPVHYPYWINMPNSGHMPPAAYTMYPAHNSVPHNFMPHVNFQANQATW